jgi:hypothetical protein
MSVWFAILAVLVFTAVWPFIDNGVRNAWRRRARQLHRAQLHRARTRLDVDA